MLPRPARVAAITALLALTLSAWPTGAHALRRPNDTYSLQLSLSLTLAKPVMPGLRASVTYLRAFGLWCPPYNGPRPGCEDYRDHLPARVRPIGGPTWGLTWYPVDRVEAELGLTGGAAVVDMYDFGYLPALQARATASLVYLPVQRRTGPSLGLHMGRVFGEPLVPRPGIQPPHAPVFFEVDRHFGAATDMPPWRLGAGLERFKGGSILL